MDEKIISKRQRVGKAGDEAGVFGGYGFLDGRQGGPFAKTSERFRVAAIASKAFRTAIFQPAIQDSTLAGQQAEKYLLMIARKEIMPHHLVTERAELFDYTT